MASLSDIRPYALYYASKGVPQAIYYSYKTGDYGRIPLADYNLRPDVRRLVHLVQVVQPDTKR